MAHSPHDSARGCRRELRADWLRRLRKTCPWKTAVYFRTSLDRRWQCTRWKSVESWTPNDRLRRLPTSSHLEVIKRQTQEILEKENWQSIWDCNYCGSSRNVQGTKVKVIFTIMFLRTTVKRESLSLYIRKNIDVNMDICMLTFSLGFLFLFIWQERLKDNMSITMGAENRKKLMNFRTRQMPTLPTSTPTSGYEGWPWKLDELLFLMLDIYQVLVESSLNMWLSFFFFCLLSHSFPLTLPPRRWISSQFH